MATNDVSTAQSTTNGASQTRRVALITGITGQDGSYLAELLLGKGYEVHGIIRRSSSFNTGRIEHLYADPKSHTQGGDIRVWKGADSEYYPPVGPLKYHECTNMAGSLLIEDLLPSQPHLSSEMSMKLHYGDLTDSSCLVKIIAAVRPSEIYNLGAQSHVKVSFDLSEYTANVDALGVLRILDAIRTTGLTDQVKFYQASTSELYGLVQEIPQKETTPFYPRSPYGVAKLYGYWIVVNYREAYNMFACNGILFNHESPRRGETFVTRKITRAVAKISLGQQECVELGNLDAKRDWGHAKDYVEAMWMMLQQDKPCDLVISTGVATSVRDFVEAAFSHVGTQICWEGEGVDEIGRDKATGVIRVKVNAKFYRPTEVEFLLGDCTKAREVLGWTPKYDLKALVKDMMESDLELMTKNPSA